jgi:DNA-binding MarR family transcriptional regulator
MDDTSHDIETDTASQLADLLGVASRRLRRGTANLLAPMGLTVSQARVLQTVAGTPEPPRMADLAAQLGVVPRSATTTVDALETAGYVERRNDASDRRSVLVAVTPSGRRLVQRLAEARRIGAEALFASLSSGERAQLLSLLRAVCEHGACGCCAGGPGGGPDVGHGPHDHAHRVEAR